MRNFFVITACLFAVFFVILISLVGPSNHFFNTNDYFFHLYKAQGSCFVEKYSLSECEGYAPGFSFLSSFFAGSESLFIIFVLIILIFIIPGVIYHKTRSTWSLLIYFSSSFVFNILYASIFAQMLLTVIVVLMLYSEKINVYVDTILLAIGYFTHSHWVFVLIPIMGYKFLNHFSNIQKFKDFFGFVVLKEKTLDFSTIFKLGPIINWFYSFQLDGRKLLLIAYFTVTSIIGDFRAILFVPILWAFWLPQIIEKKPGVHKLLILNYLAWFIFECIAWFGDIKALQVVL